MYVSCHDKDNSEVSRAEPPHPPHPHSPSLERILPVITATGNNRIDEVRRNKGEERRIRERDDVHKFKLIVIKNSQRCLIIFVHSCYHRS